MTLLAAVVFALCAMGSIGQINKFRERIYNEEVIKVPNCKEGPFPYAKVLGQEKTEDGVEITEANRDELIRQNKVAKIDKYLATYPDTMGKEPLYYAKSFINEGMPDVIWSEEAVNEDNKAELLRDEKIAHVNGKLAAVVPKRFLSEFAIYGHDGKHIFIPWRSGVKPSAALIDAMIQGKVTRVRKYVAIGKCGKNVWFK